FAGCSRVGFDRFGRRARGRRFLLRFGASSAAGAASAGVSACVWSTASAPGSTEVSADSVPESLAESLGSATCSFLSDCQNSGDLAALQLELRRVLQLPRRRL